jgi:hypothetical protein
VLPPGGGSINKELIEFVTKNSRIWPIFEPLF